MIQIIPVTYICLFALSCISLITDLIRPIIAPAHVSMLDIAAPRATPGIATAATPIPH